MALVFKPANLGKIVPVGSKFRIDWSHPITQGLVNCYLPGIMDGADLCGRWPLAYTSNTNFTGYNPDGPGSKSTSSSSAIGLSSASIGATDPLIGWDGLTLFYRGSLNAANGGRSDNCTLFGINYDSGGGPPYVVANMFSQGPNNLANAYNFGGSFGAVNYVTVPEFSTANAPFGLCSTFKVNGNVIFYVNGVSAGSAAFGAAASTGTATSAIDLAGQKVKNACFGVVTNIAAFWTRVLTPEEVRYLDANPYCFLIADEGEIPPLVLPVAAGNPPFDMRAGVNEFGAVHSWFPGFNAPLPIIKSKINPSALNVRYDNPPFTHNGRDALTAATIDTWPRGWDAAILPRKIAAAIAPAVSGIIPRTAAWLGVVLSAWTPLATTPVLAKNLSPALIGSINAPPVRVVAADDAVASWWVPDKSLPIVGRKLVPPSTDNPPVNSTAKEQLAAGGQWPSGWSLPIVGPKLVPGSVDNPLVRSGAKEQLAGGGQWPSGWSLPILPQKLTPPSLDAPPVKQPHDIETSAGIFSVWPQGWGLPPTGPKLIWPTAQVDNPPIRSSAAYQLAAGGEWPSGWSLPIVGPKIVPSTPSAELPGSADDFAVVETYSQYFFGQRPIAALVAVPAQVDNPPTRSNAKEQLAAGGLWPSGWTLPIVGPKLVPGSVDAPARTSAINQAAAGLQWPRGWDLPILPPKITPPSNDAPPVVSSAKRQHAAGGEWPSGWTLPIVGPKLVQRGPDSPPVRSSAKLQLAAGGEWPSGWTLPLLPPKIVPPSLDRPVPSKTTWQVNIAVAWIPPAPLPTLSQKATPPSTDSPPVKSNAWRQLAAGGDWPRGWDLPITGPKLVQRGPDSPPVKSNAVRQLAAGGEWPQGWTLPLVGPKLVQPERVDYPPPDMRRAINAFGSVYAWFPAADQPLPIVTGKLNPSGLNVLYNQPPFSHRGRLAQTATAIGSWPIGWTLPIVTGKINPTALNVLYNPPPFSHRGRTVQAATAIASWPIGWTLPIVKPPVIRDEPPTPVDDNLFTVSGPTVEGIYPHVGINQVDDVVFPYKVHRRTK